uniref:Transposase (Putative), gypsy type n=1 Tax=Tanacetum cinerariifolium TaxID=118510 RepID=A0A6L2KBF1_TANCI|nr:hypothetical protein [Tanacetum cinerariifolium]
MYKENQVYGKPIPDVMLSKEIMDTTAYNTYLAFITRKFIPKKARKRTKDHTTPMKESSLTAGDNIIFEDPDAALELAKSISRTEVEEQEAARLVLETHERLVTKKLTKRRRWIERLATDTKKAIKSSKLATGPRQTKGSSKGAGLIPEVPDELTVGTGAHDDSKDIWGTEREDDKEDDNDDDQSIDLEDTDDDENEHDNDETQRDEYVHKDEYVHMDDDEQTKSDNKDQAIDDVEKNDEDKAKEEKDTNQGPIKDEQDKDEIEEGRVPLLDSTVGRVIPLAGKDDQARKIGLKEMTMLVKTKQLLFLWMKRFRLLLISLRVKGRKKEPLVMLVGLFKRSTLNVKISVAATETVSFITSFMTPTAKHEGGGDIDSISGPNLSTQNLYKRFVISSDYSHYSSADAEVASFVRVGVELDTQVHQSIFVDSASIGAARPDIACPSNPTGTELFADTFYVSQEMDSETLPCPSWTLFPASQMWFEHNLRERKRLEGRCARQVDMMKEKDVEITNLKAQLSLREAEATEAIRFSSQVSAVEAAEATRVSKLNSLKEQNIALEKEKILLGGTSCLQASCDELSIKVASLKSQRGTLIDRVCLLKTTCFRLRDQVSGYELFKEWCEAIQDDQVKKLSYHVLVGDGSLVTALGWPVLNAINYQSIDHRKTGMGLTDVAAYDPSVEASRLQPAYEQLLLPIHRQEDKVVFGETSLSKSLNVVHDLVQKLKKGVTPYRTSISNAMGALVNPLPSENLIGEASTLEVPATATATITSSISVTAISAR